MSLTGKERKKEQAGEGEAKRFKMHLLANLVARSVPPSPPSAPPVLEPRSTFRRSVDGDKRRTGGTKEGEKERTSNGSEGVELETQSGHRSATERETQTSQASPTKATTPCHAFQCIAMQYHDMNMLRNSFAAITSAPGNHRSFSPFPLFLLAMKKMQAMLC